MSAESESGGVVRVEVFREPGGHLLAYAINDRGELAWVRYDEEVVPVEAMAGTPLFQRLEAQAAERAARARDRRN